MAVTSYQVNSVLNAYARKRKLKNSPSAGAEEGSDAQGCDGALPPPKDNNQSEEFEKISNGLRDVFLKDENI
ncbi:MAG: hypothetical protein EG826_08170 [Deltaproteobacteria bacterium]|nr:hypothetical protein [Deltaproteobacteria bacterium]